MNIFDIGADVIFYIFDITAADYIKKYTNLKYVTNNLDKEYSNKELMKRLKKINFSGLILSCRAGWDLYERYKKRNNFNEIYWIKRGEYIVNTYQYGGDDSKVIIRALLGDARWNSEIYDIFEFFTKKIMFVCIDKYGFICQAAKKLFNNIIKILKIDSNGGNINNFIKNEGFPFISNTSRIFRIEIGPDVYCVNHRFNYMINVYFNRSKLFYIYASCCSTSNSIQQLPNLIIYSSDFKKVIFAKNDSLEKFLDQKKNFYEKLKNDMIDELLRRECITIFKFLELFNY
jgi:hypothetical protein